MSNALSRDVFTPWHAEPWAWFIVGIMMFSVSWGTFEVYLAFHNADSVVVDDYYKNGKAINADLTRDQNAQQQTIGATLVIDDLTGEVHVFLTSVSEDHPTQLKLSLLSPVFSSKDKVITLNRSISGDYIGQLQEQATGDYYVQLETFDQLIPEVGYESGWRISNKSTVIPGVSIKLGY
ncbi:MAG: FixH family protein [Candidatus Endonucleobacter bathymodioli]|uniref:FixH family protein n=1 Tax=Candidatus Endonucleibacter bathymodioli TaxID=539814 RepID=A0AA90SSD3_9GAMM|nr:FixH family protein [Candidatus Endonucleobacter bathymodioli]